jgi:dihydrolipoamide dehydrogenase
MKTQVAVIGGGPGGYTTAIRLKQLGIDAVLFEQSALGGECLNWGCIPTKTLVKNADFFHEIRKSDSFGITAENVSYDYTKIAARKDQVVAKLVKGLEHLFKKRDIPVVSDKVHKITEKGEEFIVQTEKEEYVAVYVVLATGSIPASIPSMPFDGSHIINSRDVVSFKDLPEHISIIGGGTIGCEFASIFANFGVNVEIIELLPTLLSNEDQEIVRKFQLSLKKKGVKIYLDTKVEDYQIEEDGVKLTLSNDKVIKTKKVLVSIGRIPNLSLDVSALNLQQDKSKIVINGMMQTSNKRVFAIGDLTGKLMLAHTASKQGIIAASAISEDVAAKKSDPKKELVYENIPRCTFTDPELASVGLTEQQAADKGYEFLTGKFSYMANGKALGLGAPEGMIKILADKKERKIIGMHILGAQATELITAGSIMINTGLSVDQLHNVVFAHPTLSEVIMEALEDLDDLSVHKV